MSVDIHDVITCATFCYDRLRALSVARGRISRFPIDLRRRPYNTLALQCECVISTVTTAQPTTSTVNNSLTSIPSVMNDKQHTPTWFTVSDAYSTASIASRWALWQHLKLQFLQNYSTNTHHHNTIHSQPSQVAVVYQ